MVRFILQVKIKMFQRIRGVYCDDALYKLTHFTLTFTHGLSQYIFDIEKLEGKVKSAKIPP